jgi:integrase
MRQPKPWFRASKNAWYVEYNFKQIRLGEHPAGEPPPKRGKLGWNPPLDIVRAFNRLIIDGSAQPIALDDPAVATICDLFLAWSQKHHKDSTYAWNKSFLESFANFERTGHLLATKLKPLHVTRWLDAHPSWKGSRTCAVTVVKRAFNWAESEGVLDVSPLKKLKKPPPPVRDRLLSIEERAEIMGAARGPAFKQFLVAMQESGCRPGEIRTVEARHTDLALGVWVFDEHKTAKKTGKPRVVYLTPTLLAMTTELVGRNPTGPLFLNSRGKPWTRNAVRIRFRNLRKKLPHLKRFFAYAYRASFATDALESGVGIAQVAELLGHVDTKMVMRHYSRLSQKVSHLRDAAARAAGHGGQAPNIRSA